MFNLVTLWELVRRPAQATIMHASSSSSTSSSRETLDEDQLAIELNKYKAASSMRAVVYDSYGGPEKLRLESKHPLPGTAAGDAKTMLPNHIIVRVHATSVNPIDWKMMKGFLKLVQFGKVFPFVPCFDFSGVVVEVGIVLLQDTLFFGGGANVESIYKPNQI